MILKKNLYAFFASFGAVLSLLVLTLSPPKLSTKDPVAEWKSISTVGSISYDLYNWRPPVGFQRSEIVVDWELNLQYPNKTVVGRAALVKVTPLVKKVTFLGVTSSGKKIKLSSNPDRETEEAKEFLSGLENGIVSLKLDIAGATVSPKELNSFVTEGVSGWSVSFANQGEHKGIVSVSKSPPHTRLVGDPTLSIMAYSTIFSPRNIFSAIGVILGPLISIPGLYAFLRELRRERNRKSCKDEKESTRIIIP